MAWHGREKRRNRMYSGDILYRYLCVRNIGDAFEGGTPEEIACCLEIYGRDITKEEWNRRCVRKKSETKIPLLPVSGIEG